MFASLQGNITHIAQGQLVLNVHQVGYLVSTPISSIQKFKIGQEIILHIHTVVSETDIRLFGFETLKELYFFKKLLKVKGVGPKVALAIFELPLNVIEVAIMGGDHKTLATVPGLGKKTAEQICLDLRGKLDFSFAATTSGSENIAPSSVTSQNILEASEALFNLGCDRGEVVRRLTEAPADLSSEELVRWFLLKEPLQN